MQGGREGRQEAAVTRRSLRRDGRCFREWKGFQSPLSSGSGDNRFCQLHAKLRGDSYFFKRAILKNIWSLLIVWMGRCELPYFTQPSLRRGPAEVLISLTLDWWCLFSLQGCREGAVPATTILAWPIAHASRLYSPPD